MNKERTRFSDVSRVSVADGEPVSNAPGPEGALIYRETVERLRRALDTLSDKNREVIRMRFEERLSYPEIAARVQRSPEAARKVVDRVADAVRGGDDGN